MIVEIIGILISNLSKSSIDIHIGVKVQVSQHELKPLFSSSRISHIFALETLLQFCSKAKVNSSGNASSF